MKSVFDQLLADPAHTTEFEKHHNKQVLKIFREGKLIAKKRTLKKQVQYFGVTGCETLCTPS